MLRTSRRVVEGMNWQTGTPSPWAHGGVHRMMSAGCLRSMREFIEARVGVQGRTVRMYWLRSMYVDAEARVPDLQLRDGRAGAILFNPKTTCGSPGSAVAAQLQP